MSNLNTVKQCATMAGNELKGRMQSLIRGESGLSSYRDVSNALQVFEDQDNLVVGIPPDSPVIERAWAMHGIYPLKDVAHDLAVQSGDMETTFLGCLGEALAQ
jgi:hypothetical protein